MNHTLLAREALRFRLASVHRALDPSRFDLDGAAAFAVSCGDPVVDSAIRRVVPPMWIIRIGAPETH